MEKDAAGFPQGPTNSGISRYLASRLPYCMHGLAGGGVGKRASAPRPAPTQQEEDAEVAARRIQIRLTGRKSE
jgi:hypothetical protein